MVRTGLAVPASEALPDVVSATASRAALLGARAIDFPDPALATAGIHFAGLMRQLGLLDALTPRFYTCANGATAMREQAAGALPTQFELLTACNAAVSATAGDSALAAQLIEMLAGEASRALRLAGGFTF